MGIIVTGQYDSDHAHHHHEKEKVFDYKNLLTANLNLTDKINEGSSLFFDCPPMCFNQASTCNDNYWNVVNRDNPIEIVKPSTPRIFEK
jgi:hypothetical protein